MLQTAFEPGRKKEGGVDNRGCNAGERHTDEQAAPPSSTDYVECPTCGEMFVPSSRSGWIAYKGKRICDPCEAVAPNMRKAGSEVVSLPRS